MFSSPAFAQTAGAPTPAGGGFASFSLFIPMILVIGIFYVLVHMPQQKRMKEHKAQLDAAKKGDVVVTGGGLIGRITKVDGDEIEIELAPTIKVRAVKSTLTEVRGTSKPAND